MANQLRPKELFQANEDIRKELAVVVQSSNFQFAVSFALTEFMFAATPSAEQLTAVRTFIAVLMNLPLPEEPMRTLPSRTLDHSVLHPRRPDSPNQPK